MIKVRNFIIYNGYAESASWSALVVRNKFGFNSIEEGLQNLGGVVRKAVEEEEANTYHSACCKSTLENNLSSANPKERCGKCNKKLIFPPLQKRMEAIIHEWMSSTMDGFGFVWEEFDSNGWTLFGGAWCEKNHMTNIAIISQYGASLLAMGAYGRIFDPDYDCSGGAFKSAKDAAAYGIIVPKGIRLFKDD